MLPRIAKNLSLLVSSESRHGCIVGRGAGRADVGVWVCGVRSEIVAGITSAIFTTASVAETDGLSC